MHPELIVAKLITMALGFLIAYQAYRGYRRNRRRPMLYFAIGFVFISFGAVIEGLLFDVIGLTLSDSSTVATIIVAVGMLSVLYALYGRDTKEVEN